MKILPALYQVEPIGIDDTWEANGTVYYFCDDDRNVDCCRNRFLIKQTEPPFFISGTSPDAIGGTVCDECGKVLIEEDYQ